MFAQSILRGSFEGKLSAEPLVAAQCVCLFVCLNPFYSLLLPPCWGGGGVEAPPAKVSVQTEIQSFAAERPEFTLGR